MKRQEKNEQEWKKFEVKLLLYAPCHNMGTHVATSSLILLKNDFRSCRDMSTSTVILHFHIQPCRDMTTLLKTLLNTSFDHVATWQHRLAQILAIFGPVSAHFSRTIYSSFIIIIRVQTLRQEHSIFRVSHLSLS